MTNEPGPVGHLVDEAIIQDAQPFDYTAPAVPYSTVQFNPVPFTTITVHLSGNEDSDNTAMQYAVDQFFIGQHYIDAIVAVGPLTIETQPMPQNPPQTPPVAAQQPVAPQMAPPPTYGQGNAQGQPIQGQSHPEDNKYECPEHPGVMLRKTAAKFDDSGDRFYHPMPQEAWYQNERGMTVKNHNLWRSQLLGGGA